MTGTLPNEIPKTWLWRLKRILKPTKEFCELINTKPSTFYAIANGTINASVDKVTRIELALRALEKGAEDL